MFFINIGRLLLVIIIQGVPETCDSQGYTAWSVAYFCFCKLVLRNSIVPQCALDCCRFFWDTLYIILYTYLQNKRMRRCGVAPPPIIFERLKLPQQIIYRRKENLSESPNHQKYWENILVSRFYEQFSRNRRNLGHFRKFEKISNSLYMNILYIILKHVIWRFQIYNLFREIFKFREDKSNNVFREIRKCFRKTAKFDFFTKQIIYLESPDHPLQNDI